MGAVYVNTDSETPIVALDSISHHSERTSTTQTVSTPIRSVMPTVSSSLSSPVKSVSTVKDGVILYGKAVEAMQCALSFRHLDAESSSLSELTQEELNDLQQRTARAFATCRNPRLTSEQINELLTQAADAGQQEAQQYLLNNQLLAEERLREEQIVRGSTLPATAAEIEMVEKMKGLAYNIGSRDALEDLANVYINGSIVPQNMITAYALQVVANTLNVDEPVLDESSLPDVSLSDEEKKSILLEAREIRRKCCQRNS